MKLMTYKDQEILLRDFSELINTMHRELAASQIKMEYYQQLYNSLVDESPGDNPKLMAERSLDWIQGRIKELTEKLK